MKKIMFATGNPSKAKRFSKGLKKDDIEVLSLNDLNIYKTGIIESSFNENSDNVLFKNGMTTAQEFLEI